MSHLNEFVLRNQAEMDRAYRAGVADYNSGEDYTACYPYNASERYREHWAYGWSIAANMTSNPR